jgi:aldehyde:ferredoxin oxidoreductase
MEAYEKDILSDSDIGFPLKWSDGDAIIKMIEKIAKKEGFGKVLSEGVKIASEITKKDSDNFAIHVKGLEVPMHNPRLYHTMALIYAMSSRGACHLQGLAMLIERGMLLPEYGIGTKPKDLTSKIRAVTICQSLCEFIDSVGLCKFGAFGVIDFDHLAETLNAITGRNESKDSILRIGNRIWYLERLLNLRLGLRSQDDTLPRRFVEEQIENGPIKGMTCPIDILIPEFYRVMRLDLATGMPDPKKIEEQNII